MARVTIYQAVTTSATVTKATQALTANPKLTAANRTLVTTVCASRNLTVTTAANVVLNTLAETASPRSILVTQPRAYTATASKENDHNGRQDLPQAGLRDLRMADRQDLHQAAAAAVVTRAGRLDSYPLMRVMRQDNCQLMKVTRLDNCQLMKVTKLDSCQLMKVTKLDNCPLMKVMKVCSCQQTSRQKKIGLRSHRTSPSRVIRTSPRVRTDRKIGQKTMTNQRARTSQKKKDNHTGNTEGVGEVPNFRFRICRPSRTLSNGLSRQSNDISARTNVAVTPATLARTAKPRLMSALVTRVRTALVTTK